MADETKTPEQAHVDGFVRDGFEKVRDAFRASLEDGSDIGSSVAVYYEGELVVNLWGGWIEKEAGLKWREDTMPCVYSSTKSPSALVIAHLVDRGLLDYNEKISKYWPEFGQNGKEDITLETYITNKAGLSGNDEPLSIRLMLDDPKKFGELLAKQKPLWEPGTKHGYHPMTFALYLDQIVRRVDPEGRSLAQYFQEEMAGPFDIEFYIGLPKELYYRAPRSFMLPNADILEMMKKMQGDPEITKVVNETFTDVLTMNNPYIREVPVGSAFGHGTTASLAKFHGILANGGVHNGKRLLSEEAIQRQLELKSYGKEVVYGMEYMFSLGTMVVASMDDTQPPVFSFGHGGFGGQMVIADPTHKVGFAYASNHLNLDIENERRWKNLYDVVYECVYKIKNITAKRSFFQTYAKMKAAQDA
ncbi:beta-lactamase domain-containing protein 2-like [Mizuhopecten yessoensis]|uniref:Beta-lactamase domain-containing protein 2 n=1 Tax=Mizuhopecten yessoensis TaxID=6573 RepID=A0A210PF47_MIZYE|nr:beta-lactamase domain-containing protein 2-like [Mizuhopecten yessoensis]OWF35081.1 Beta-lactamase domain-containing protein 2 [Mizuhopecten yessoensis]